ncbi:MAG: Thioredoxin-like protein [Chlorobi bacterium]|nr:Thioredoxin-like protein [Chlorobiota bacterium]
MNNIMENRSAMRTLVTLALCALVTLVASCTSSPTATTTTTLGQTTIEEFLTNTGYKAWYQTGYDSYPSTEGKTTFDQSVATIKSSFDPSRHTIVMAVKPNCGCQTTQTWMPPIMKALDAAGIPHDHVILYVTDSRLNGIADAVKQQYRITDAPMFIVMNGDKVAGTINTDVTQNRTPVEKDLASYLSQK